MSNYFIALFYYSGSLTILYPNLPNIRNSTLEDCARACLENLNCLSFDFTTTYYNNCYLNNKIDSSGLAYLGKDYKHYISE